MTASAHAAPLFAAPFWSFDAGDSPEPLAIGDLNGDGRPDLVTGSFPHSVSVLLGNGDGTFGARTDYDAVYSPISVAIGDLNGDGHLDLAVAGGNSVFSVLLGN